MHQAPALTIRTIGTKPPAHRAMADKPRGISLRGWAVGGIPRGERPIESLRQYKATNPDIHRWSPDLNGRSLACDSRQLATGSKKILGTRQYALGTNALRSRRSEVRGRRSDDKGFFILKSAIRNSKFAIRTNSWLFASKFAIRNPKFEILILEP